MARTVATHPTAQADPTTGTDPPSRPPRATRGGRPSRVDALRLSDRILEVATELFLREGYGSTSIESVARLAGISKRTFYHRFEGKAELFAAVVHRIIGGIRPPPDVPLLEGATLREVLRRLAGFILQAALSPPALALHRLITAEAARFPELARAVLGEGSTAEGTALIGGLLARECDEARLPVAAHGFAAQQFIDMVITLPQRRALGLGAPMTATELDTWADDVVTLFLNGCRGWSTAEAPPAR